MEDFKLKGLSFTQAINVIWWFLTSSFKADLYLYYLRMGALPKYAYIKAYDN